MSFIGVVLAGGQSKRMGSDKALLSLEGEDMLSRTVKCLLRGGAAQIIISRNGQNEQALSDIYPNKGPLSGVHAAALNFARSDLLLVPVDLPHLSYKEIQRLSQYAQRQQQSCYFTGHHLPLYLRHNKTNIEVLEHILLATEDYSVAGLIRQIDAQAIQPLDPMHLINTNTPAQWQQAQQAILAGTHARLTHT